MWITGQVDLPPGLIAAQQRGDLVVFVGAGVSMDAPSSLPSFAGLTERIAVGAGVEPPTGSVPLDQFLGDLDGRIDVHQRVHDIISIVVSEPNALHRALVRLPKGNLDIRIVTTNYDLHLSTARAELGGASSEFDGPALPLGNDFSGIVYLHGSVRQHPRFLVVTDRDFGHAYLTEAWAARFLHAMFRQYVVLFVGYSHDDVVMTYLARALPSDAVRFAMTPASDAGRWRRIGITPIPYPVSPTNGHSELVRALAKWADDSHMGLLGQRERIRTLVQVPPPDDPADRSYLEAAVADPGQVGFFTEFATGEDWLTWASEQPAFKELFGQAPASGVISRTLSLWFSSFAVDDALSGVALLTAQRLGGRLSPELWWTVAQAFHAADPNPSCRNEWAVVLTSTAPDDTADFLEYMLVACRWPTDRHLALLLLDYLVQVRLVLGPTWTPVDPDEGGDRGPGRYVHADVRLRGDDHWLDEAWAEVFRPNLADCAGDVIVISERHLRDAHRRLRLLGKATDHWDPISFQRSAVEPHEQDHVGREVNVLIDAARDSIEHLLKADAQGASAIVDDWSRSEVPVLRRLAIHAWTNRSDRTVDEKVRYAVTSGWLYAPSLKHETFQLLKTTLPEASPDVVDAVVDAASAGPAERTGRSSDYEVFNLLSWVTTLVPDAESAQAALAAVRTDHPDFAPRDHPDLNSYMETGWVPEQLPMTVADFHDIVSRDVGEAVEAVIRYREASSPFDGPTLGDALGLVVQTVADHPEDGYRLLNALAGDAEAVRVVGGAVVRGLGASSKTIDDWTPLIDHLLAMPDLSLVADDVSELLEEGSRNRESGLRPENLQAARRLAGTVWPHLSGSSVDGGEWLSRAINSGFGRIAEFWLHSISIEIRAAGEEWAGLDEVTTATLDMMVGATTEDEALAAVVAASQLHFLFAADEEWTTKTLLPLFDWTRDEHRAEQAWDGFLSWGRWNDRLLAAGLRVAFERSFSKLGAKFDEEHRWRFCEHVAGIVVSSSIPDIGMEMAKGLVAVADAASRASFASAIASVLKELPAEVAVARWDAWIKDYLADRVAGVPRPMSREEATEVARWLLHLGDRFPAAVALVAETPAGLGEHSDVLYRLKDADLLTTYPHDVVKLVTQLARHTEPPFWGCSFLGAIVDRVRSSVDQALLTQLVEEALRLGCTGAPGWLEG
ncbi:MAG TPA: SIR2 family protein [Acidimicrobiales bacterium]|nr:SIR2 family protein [Acidimicrobiales bacterium]